MSTDYTSFLSAKRHTPAAGGFEPVWLPDCLMPFQRHLSEWEIRTGRTATLADCGMGKSLLNLVAGENVVRRTNRPYLVACPLAVCGQFVREAEKFGVEAVRSADGKVPAGARVVVTNYERLEKFDPADFGGAGMDESGILKNFDGRRKAAVTEFLRTLPYRHLYSATAAPNDYVELGTHSEALGDLGYMDMLARFFKNDQNSNHPNRLWAGAGKWRFRGHAERDFWRWVCGWARAVRKPSDLGFADGPFVLPPLEVREHTVRTAAPAPGRLFDVPAVTLAEQREEQRRTLEERCGKVAELVAHGEPAVVWCHLNAEADLCERLIPGARQIAGSTPDERKEELFDAFTSGQLRVLVIKPRVGAWGLNWQHCAHMTFFASYSFEQYYQSVRRCWRFGQTRPVRVDLIATEGQAGIKASLARKAANADAMFARLVELMNDSLRLDRTDPYTRPVEAPSWL